jgi:beta-lactamase regulating signal transducer with metallopeptidase domain
MLALLVESALRSLLLGGAVWIGLKLLRVKNPHVHMASWTMVLLASLSMPVLMHSITMTIPASPLPVQTPEMVWASASLPPEPLNSLEATQALEPGGVAVKAASSAINWWALATAVYAAIAGLLLLRLATGLYLTWRLACSAQPIGERWALGLNVRASDIVGVPVTFGATILLPSECMDWDGRMRQAVLSHEGAHVANGDFYVLLLASLNRAVFWFSPFAWWQLVWLAELAEITSDDAALEGLDNRLSYAEILLELAGNVQPAPAGLAMARASTVRRRVERILAATETHARIGWRKRIWTASAIAPLVAISAVTIAYGTASGTAATKSVSEYKALTPPAPAAIDARLFDRYTGYYLINPGSIFAVNREGNGLFGQLTGQRRLQIFPDRDGKFFYAAVAGKIAFTLAVDGDQRAPELVLHQHGRDLRAPWIAGASQRDQLARSDPALLDTYVGWYELTPSRSLAVVREGDRLFVQETGRPKVEAVALGDQDHFAGGDALVIFLRDGKSKVTQLLLQEPASGARRAIRVDLDRAKTIEDAFLRRIAEVPDRFKDQTPAPGGKAAILRGIEDMQRGAPNYERMSPQLAAKIQRQLPHVQAMLTALGAVESIYFRGVGPGGYDIYGVKFANGFAEFRLLLGGDGRAHDVIFRPDGDDTPGGVVGCSEERTLKSSAGAVPIRLLFYNASGSDIQLFELDRDGKRAPPHGTIGDDASSTILTYVGSPWVVTDASGQCLEIVLPGQRTRYLTLEAPRAGNRVERSVSPRSTPMAGSEESLRQYIEALGRGEPIYQLMTPEVAAETRQQLPMNRAIVAKLGALRSVSFRGVSSLGSDVYIAYFANGSAEWRIGLVKDGKIGRIALGPQY